MGKPKKEETYLWVDLETTGLDPQRCVPIEVAAVITGPDLEPRATYTAQIQTDIRPSMRQWEGYAWRMHHGNGLLLGLDSADPIDVVQARLVDFLAQHIPIPVQAILCGSSVHFDRGFLVRHMPMVEMFLGHRHLDVSAIRLAMQAWGYPPQDPKPEPAHRALADIHGSIAELKYWMQYMTPTSGQMICPTCGSDGMDLLTRKGIV